MNAGQYAEQVVELAVAAGATLEYYPAITIPFPDRYKDPKTTTLTCRITDSKQTLNLELKD